MLYYNRTSQRGVGVRVELLTALHIVCSTNSQHCFNHDCSLTLIKQFLLTMTTIFPSLNLGFLVAQISTIVVVIKILFNYNNYIYIFFFLLVPGASYHNTQFHPPYNSARSEAHESHISHSERQMKGRRLILSFKL